MLVDEILYLKIAQEEHDQFAQVLKDNGVRVLYLEDILANSLRDAETKANFIDRMLEESGIKKMKLRFLIHC